MRNTRKSGQILRSKKRPRPTLRSGRGSRTNSNTSHQIPAWVIEADSARAATFTFAVCEPYVGEGHHPNISFGWGNATVSLQTKKIKGLHENDFIMATKIDRIFARTAAA